MKRDSANCKIVGEDLPVKWCELRMPNGDWVIVDVKEARMTGLGRVRWLVSRRCFGDLWAIAREVSRTSFSAKRILEP